MKISPSTQMTQQVAGGIGLIFSCFIVYSITVALIDEADIRFIAVAVGFIVALTANPLAGQIKANQWRWVGWVVDVLLVVSFCYSAWWFFEVKEELWTGFYIGTPANIFAGALGLVGLLEATRRAWGWSLVILAFCFVSFGFAGPYLPGVLQHFGMDLSNFMQIAWYSFDGVFGRVTGLVFNTVLVFLILGAMMSQTGAGDSLIKISTVLTARIRGGAAHAAIVASALFGMMSGSVAANIAGTGVFTIPMIKKQGFSNNFAAAVEASASSGGQLTPPIMAAAVFVMADLLGEPYLLLIAAAALPALFKYISLFAQVYGEALRLGHESVSREKLTSLSRRDWVNALLFVSPLSALMTAFLMGYSPAMSGFIGLMTALVIGLVLSPEFRRKPIKIVKAFSLGGVSAANIMIAVALIGIVLGVVNETGIAIRFAIAISSFGESHLIIALVLAMFGALILGMGLPTLPAYLIIAIMIAPAIIKAGVDPIAAHMFVLYYAVYSSIVPPIAYGCYVAAPIAGGNPLATSLIALRLSVIGLLVPYVFVYSPSLLLIVDGFTWSELAGTVIRLIAAIWMFAACFAGVDPVTGRLSMIQRFIRFILGASALWPIAMIWLPGVSLAFLMVVIARVRSARPI
jgi:TRAP transporter 4TM/12TM fusion protein